MKSGPVALRLARRELRGGIKGFRVFLACLTLGVGAIAAVGSISSAMLGGLAIDGQTILGGDVSLRISHRDITPAQRAWLEREGADSRSVFMRAMTRPEKGGAHSLIDLKAVDGLYPLFGAAETDPPMALADALAKRDGMWGAVVDAALLMRLGIAIGEKVRIGDAVLQVRAILTREPDRVGGVRPLALGPRVLISDASLPDTGLIRPGSQVRYVHRVRLGSGVALTQWRSALKAAFPDAGWSITDRTNASPTVKRFVDRTALFLTLVGLTALMVGGVGVGNAVHSYLGRKMSIIATMKCLGATSPLIFRIYLAQIVIMAGLGIAGGLLLGVAAPFVMAALFPSNELVLVGLGVYVWPLALAALFGILTTIAFSVWPLARACVIQAGALFRDAIAPTRRWPQIPYIAITAAAALALAGLAVATAVDRTIAWWFVGGSVACLILFRLAGTLVVLAARRARFSRWTAVRLGVANLHRPGAATAGVVMSLGLGLTVLVTVALIEGNMRHQIKDSLPEKAPSYFFIDIQPNQVMPFEQTVRRLDQRAEVRRTPMLRGRITEVNGVPAEKVREKADPGVRWVLRGDRGLTWAATPPEGANIVDGKWWPADYAGPPLVSLAESAARGLGVGVGDTLTFNILGRSLTARVASLRRVRWGSLRMNFVVMFSPGVIEKAPQTHLATLRTRDEMERRIEDAVVNRFPNITAIRVKDVLTTVNHFLERIGIAVRLTAGVTIIAGILVLAGAVAAGHSRRVYESVVLKVLGATRGDVVRAYLVEFGALGLATAAVAAVLGSISAWAVITQVMKVDWVFLPSVLAATVVLSTLITLGFGLVGTWRALGQKAAPHLRNK